MADLVHVSRDGDVAVVRLQRPDKLNALSTDLERALDRALTGPEVAGVRALVLHGEGRAFSAGADITEFRDRDPASIMAAYREAGAVNERLATLPAVTIAAVHGWALGGGLELALACDVRIADETARVGLPEVGLGILPASGGVHRAVQVLGPARARELMLLGTRLPAPEALRLGLVTEVVPAGTHVERALALAAEAATLPPLAVQVTKAAIDAAAESSRESALLVERLAYAMLAQTTDADEAAAAFGAPRQSGGGGG